MKKIYKILFTSLFTFISATNLMATDTKYCEVKKNEIDTQVSCDPQFSQYYDYFGTYKTLVTNFKILGETTKKLNDTLKQCGEWLSADADITKMPTTCLDKVKEIPNYVKDLADSQKKGLVDILLQNSDCLTDNEQKILKNLKTRKITLVDDYDVYENFPLELIDGVLKRMKNTLDYWLQKCKNDSLKEQLQAQDELQKKSMAMQLEAQQCDRDSAEYKKDSKEYYKSHPACAAQDQYNQQASSAESFQYANLGLFAVMALPILKEMWQAISKGPSAIKALYQSYKLRPITTQLNLAFKDLNISKAAIQELSTGLKELKGLAGASAELKGLGEALKVLSEAKQIGAAGKVAEYLKVGSSDAKLLEELRGLSIVGKEAEEVLKAAQVLKRIPK